MGGVGVGGCYCLFTGVVVGIVVVSMCCSAVVVVVIDVVVYVVGVVGVVVAIVICCGVDGYIACDFGGARRCVGFPHDVYVDDGVVGVVVAIVICCGVVGGVMVYGCIGVAGVRVGSGTCVVDYGVGVVGVRVADDVVCIYSSDIVAHMSGVDGCVVVSMCLRGGSVYDVGVCACVAVLFFMMLMLLLICVLVCV